MVIIIHGRHADSTYTVDELRAMVRAEAKRLRLRAGMARVHVHDGGAVSLTARTVDRAGRPAGAGVSIAI